MGVKKSNTKKFVIICILLIVVALVIFVVVKSKSRDTTYLEDVAKVQDITKYYSFNGNIEAKNKQNVMSDELCQIKTIKVKEGDKVKKDTVLFVDSMGNEIKSDINGEVSEILVSEGQICQAGTQLTTITDYDNLQLNIKVDEYDIANVTLGKEVTVHVNSIDKDFSGKISKVSKEATTAENNVTYFTAIVDLNKDEDLRIGVSAEVKMIDQSASNVVTISTKALQFDSENKPYVNMKNSAGTIETKDVTVGINNGTIVEIKEGLSEGNIVYYKSKTNDLSSMSIN